MILDNEQLPHLLFYGPPGTGKTSTILAVAKELYGAKNLKKMVLELNASDARGIDVVRNEILNFASSRSLHCKGFKGLKSFSQFFHNLTLEFRSCLFLPLFLNYFLL